MPRGAALFQFIKSLTKSEKTYFSRFVVRSRDPQQKKYFHLFQAIDRQEVYDESALKKKFRNESFIRRFPVAKEYLFRTILKSLRHQHMRDDTNSILYALLLESELLYSRSFYEEAEKRVHKAIELAREKEKFPFLLESYDRLFRLDMLKYSYNPSNSGYTLEEALQTIEKMEQIFRIRGLLNEFKQIRDQRPTDRISASDPISVRLQSILAKPDISFRAKILGYNLDELIYSWSTQHPGHEIERSRRAVALFESNPVMAGEERLSYAAVLNNYISDLIVQGRHAEFEKYIQILSGLETEKPEHELRIFEKVVSLRLLYYLLHRRYAEGMSYYHSIRQRLDKESPKFIPNFFLGVYDSVSILCYRNNDLNGSMRALRKIFQSSFDVRPEVKTFSHLLYLIIQFEKGDLDHMEYHLKSVQRHIRLRTPELAYAKLTLDLFKSILHSPDTASEKKAFLKFKADIHPYREINREVFHFFDLEEWAQNRIERYRPDAVK